MPPIDKEKDKQQKQQEKFQAILSSLLREDDNKYCVDCDAKGPRWASWNLGVFLCIRCAGIHRNLGVHISKVKSVNLDTWTAEQIASMQSMGNSKARAVYEANLPENFRRSQTDSAMEQFIRAKYEQRKWIAKEWIPPSLTISPNLTDDESNKEKSKKVSSNNKISSNTTSTKLTNPLEATNDRKSTATKSHDPVPKTVETKKESNLVDLFDGLTDSNDAIKPTLSSIAFSSQNNNPFDLFNSNSDNTSSNIPVSFISNITPIISKVPSANTANLNSNNQQELSNLFSTNAPSMAANKVDKNSILALYSQNSANNSTSNTNNFLIPTQQTNAFNTFPNHMAAQINTPNATSTLIQQPLFNNNLSANTMISNVQQHLNRVNFNHPNKTGGVSPINQLTQSSTWNQPISSQAQMSGGHDSLFSFPSNFKNASVSPANNGSTTTMNIGNTMSSNLWD